MKKMNNKGFAISGILYSLLILFITLFMGILIILATSKFSFDKIKNDIRKKLETEVYKDIVLNGADPELKGMIPVKIDSNGKVLKADITEKWYDYSNKEWANAVVLNDKNKVYNNGDIIPEDKISGYYVWIPRYKYKLWYTEATDSLTSLDSSKIHSIDIVFENKRTLKSNGTSNGEYLTHPAFTFGSDELNGIWVGKFETGYKGANSTESAEIEIPDPSKVIIKPNSYSWRNINISNMFITSRGVSNTFNLDITSDSHMIKNTEWGSVAYLSHSKYGFDNNVYMNNNNTYMTGCGGDNMYSANTNLCQNRYGSRSDNIYNQSTTGNISGIFDMSGGSWEYVMGYSLLIPGNNSGFTEETFPENKYVDIYQSSQDKYSQRILGDATGELGPFSSNSYYSAVNSWYESVAYFFGIDASWLERGGSYEHDSRIGGSGLFYFSASDGSANPWYSFRIVIA